jgi:hypothetical protein
MKASWASHVHEKFVDVLKKKAFVGTARESQEKFVDVLKKQALVGTAC